MESVKGLSMAFLFYGKRQQGRLKGTSQQPVLKEWSSLPLQSHGLRCEPRVCAPVHGRFDEFTGSHHA